jgi:hypothetical protein
MSLGFVQAVVAQAVMAESSVTQRHWRSREGQDCCTHPERHAGVSAGGVTVCAVARWAKARIATRVEESILIEKLTISGGGRKGISAEIWENAPALYF